MSSAQPGLPNDAAASAVFGHAFEHLPLAAAVFGRDLRLLHANAQLTALRCYPETLLRPGTPLIELLRHSAARGELGLGDADTLAREQLRLIGGAGSDGIEQLSSSGLNSRYRLLESGELLLSVADVSSERRSALIAGALAEGLYDWDIVRNDLWVSDRLLQIIGFTAEHLTSTDWFGRVHPDEEELYRRTIREHFRKLTPTLRCEYRIRVEDGSWRWIADHGSAVRDASGRAVRLVGAITDISERRAAQEALRISDERYALAMEAVNEGVYDWEVGANRIYYSPRLRELMGADQYTLATPQDWRARIHPEDLGAYDRGMIDHFKGRTERFQCDYRYRTTDGDWRWARQHGMALRDAAGRVVRMAGSTGDITAEKQTAVALEQARRRLDDAINAMAEGFVLFDAEDRLVMCNTNYREYFTGPLGASFERYLQPGVKFEDFVRAAFAGGLFAKDMGEVEEFLRRRQKQRAEGSTIELKFRGGRWLQVRTVPSGNGDRVALYTDVTDAKLHAQQLGQARDRAEQALRDLQAAQKRMVMQEKMASLGELTAGIAHEIKNPLNFVNNFAELSGELLQELVAALGASAAAGEAGELIALLQSNFGKIVEHGKRADGIVKSMLLHSRGGSGQRQKADLNALVEEAVALAFHGTRARLPDFNVEIERDLAANLPRIELVTQDVSRVLLNLLTNAFHALNKRRLTETGGDWQPRLRLRTAIADQAIMLVLRDNGTGMSAEVQNKIFTPFFTTKPAGEGTGLGLSLSHDIVVQQHGGSLTVESREGEFSEFTVGFPLTQPKSG
jgi:PAS domain S-box-containing protein